ncbi:MAG TPA: AAA family ATPase [Bryobacteraceae bacterium]|nr:AAA family ATPase [Bryobacteraceae bacterium]
MEAIILIGIQGSGKTTFYRERFFDTHLRLSLDMLKTRHRLALLMGACLAAQQRFVVDNTNVLKSERKEYIDAAKTAGFRVIGYYFRPELRRAIKWNSLRKGKQAIPVAGVIGTMKRTQMPEPGEGFDELYEVTIDADNQFAIGPIANGLQA